MDEKYSLSGEISHEDAVYMIVADPMNIRFFQKQSDKMCFEAIGRNRDTIQYIWNHSLTFCRHVAICYPEIVDKLQIQNDEIYKIAISKKSSCLGKYKNPSEELINWAIDNFYDAIYYVQNPSIEQCFRAIQANEHAYRYVTICDNPNLETTIENLKKMQLVNKLKDI